MSIRLAFGTAGIRAPLGEGPERINLANVAGVAHAICSELAHGKQRGICVGHDGRTDSDVFAREVIRVARAHGFLVRAFETTIPTPVLAFATRHHDAVAGVMITASHNPPTDNGIKLYLERGAQVLPPYDQAIAARIASFEPSQLPVGEAGDLLPLGRPEVDAYLATVRSLATVAHPPPRFAYSALCGVGGAVTRRLLQFVEWIEVEEQAEPRRDFGGLMVPNPEHEVALAKLRALADAHRLELAFAHDPDADRLAVMVRERSGLLRALSGDEVGALLGDYVVRAGDAVVSTLVSGGMLELIARARGAHFERTPTGFKWIAARGRELERAGKPFSFGYEEAIGYAFGRVADDKDGIAALQVLLALAGELHAHGESLCDRLDALAREHGRFATRQLTVPRGAELPQLPADLLGPGTVRHDLPQHALTIYELGDSRVCVRPSGTEPKLKFYLHTRAQVDAGLAQADAANQRALDRLEAAIRAAI
ncbi:MAG TPA: phospho-sugar mutase [Polyangiales bacterium]|nr:phospho-sugar mutase [Polyangiales bacterium]